MLHSDLDIQEDWTDESLRSFWTRTPDYVFAFRRVAETTVDLTICGGHGKLLDVAAAEGTVTAHLSRHGLATIALEPSAPMLATARQRMTQHETRFDLVRGIAETLPFADASFDRVLCHSALDHLADPERGIREMARVTRPDGRLILTFMNYGGLTVRTARVLYDVGRALHLIPPESEHRLFWDTPVPFDHTFECTLADVSATCRPYLEFEYARGISIGWSFPGWGHLLQRFSFLRPLIGSLDRFAAPRPALADFVVSVWRPRELASWPQDDFRVRPTNPVYQRLVRSEAKYWSTADFPAFFGVSGVSPATNADLTGDPARSWLEDLTGRGPFARVAILGCDDIRWDVEWLRRDQHAHVDIYELSETVISKIGMRLGDLTDRAHFIRKDLNFVALPASAYDCIWSSGTMHLLTNLEHVLDQAHRALRPGGLFAIHGWVGENRVQYDKARLTRVNALLAQVPPPYRRADRVERPSTVFQLSPFAAVRSSEILPLARTHPGFEVVHEGATGWLFPLTMVVDCAALARAIDPTSCNN